VSAAGPASRVLELRDVGETARLAEALAPLLRAGDVVALGGGLGVGKTTFARALIHALGGGAQGVPSPTFTLLQTYTLPAFILWHFDLYRLESPDDAFELGIEEAFADGVAVIEWPERLGRWLPTTRLDIVFAFTAAEDGDARRVTIAAGGDWPARLAGAAGLDAFAPGSDKPGPDAPETDAPETDAPETDVSGTDA